MKAADIMTTKLVTIDSLATITEAARVMKKHNLRSLIVDRASDKDAYGIITATDISQAVANAKNPEQTYVCQVMTQPCIVVNPDLAVEHIANLFTRAKIHAAPVIKNKLLGIVSLTDILTQTNGLTSGITSIEAKHSSRKIAELAKLPLDESIDNDWETESDRIYENWCSG